MHEYSGIIIGRDESVGESRELLLGELGAMLSLPFVRVRAPEVCESAAHGTRDGLRVVQMGREAYEQRGKVRWHRVGRGLHARAQAEYACVPLDQRRRSCRSVRHTRSSGGGQRGPRAKLQLRKKRLLHWQSAASKQPTQSVLCCLPHLYSS